MPPGPRFFRGFRAVAIAGAAISIIGAVVCLIFLAGWMKTYFALLCLILALNFGLMLYFISHNDPSKRGKKEE